MLEAEKLWPAELLRDGLHLPCGDALHGHLRQGGHERLLRARVALKEGGLELAVTVPGDPELELADTGHQATFVIAGPVALATFLALVGAGPQELGHLGLRDLLDGRFDQRFHPVTVFRHEGFEVDRVGAMLLHGHGMVPPQDMGLTNIPHTMTSEFAHKSVYYPSPFVRHPNVFYIITDL
jgi:hypothetical protein